MAKSMALGTKVRFDPVTPLTYVDIGHLTNTGVPSPTKGNVEVTDFDSTAREKLATLPDNGEIPFSGYLDSTNAGQNAARADANNPSAPLRSFNIQLTNQAIQFTVSGYVTSFVINAGGPDEPYTFDGTILTNGATVEAAIP